MIHTKEGPVHTYKPLQLSKHSPTHVTVLMFYNDKKKAAIIGTKLAGSPNRSQNETEHKN